MGSYPFLLDEKADSVFKEIISAGWNVKSSGHVESPQGYFALVEVPVHNGERSAMADAVFEDDVESDTIFQSLFRGWYFTTENSDGLIRVYLCENQAAAHRWFEVVDNAFSIWENE